MNDARDDEIDALLRKQFDGPVPVDDFCDRVMAQLPARRRRNWPLVAGVIGGIAACWYSLWPAMSQISWRDWLSGALPTSAITLVIAMLGMALLALAWTITEVKDQYEPSSRRMSR